MTLRWKFLTAGHSRPCSAVWSEACRQPSKLSLESLDIFIDIPEKFERTFPRKISYIYKFRTVGHFIYLRPYPAAGHLITAYFISKVLKYHIAFSKCFEYHDRPAGLNYLLAIEKFPMIFQPWYLADWIH